MKRNIIVALFAFVAAGLAQGKTIVWERPSVEVNTEIEGYFRTLLEITRVELAEEETRVFLHVALRPENWVRFSSGTCLVADDKHYALKRLDGMELDKETFLTEHGYADVVFHFEPLPMKTQRFDFTEGNSDSAFKLLASRMQRQEHRSFSRPTGVTYRQATGRLASTKTSPSTTASSGITSSVSRKATSISLCWKAKAWR